MALLREFGGRDLVVIMPCWDPLIIIGRKRIKPADMAQQCPMIMVGAPLSQSSFLSGNYRLVVPLIGLMEMATVSHSVESIGSRIELRPFVVFKGITNVRCLCEKNTHSSIKPGKGNVDGSPYGGSF